MFTSRSRPRRGFTLIELHAGSVNAAFCDGSVKCIEDSINIATWSALGTRGGGEVVSADQF